MDEKINTNSLTPSEIAEKTQEIGITKVNNPFLKTFLLGFLGGAFIAFGAMFSTVVSTGLADALPYGIARLFIGLAFCLGLILVVVAGAEIFTGNILIFIAWANRKISLLSMLRNWGVVYLGNLLGSMTVAILVFLSDNTKHLKVQSEGQYLQSQQVNWIILFCQFYSSLSYAISSSVWQYG
jgi:formate/nitrite transporter FocA (FNT family)